MFVPCFADLMKKNPFRTAALHFENGRVVVERHKTEKKTSLQVVTASVVNDTLISYMESAPSYIKFVRERRLSAHCLWKSDFAEDLANFVS